MELLQLLDLTEVVDSSEAQEVLVLKHLQLLGGSHGGVGQAVVISAHFMSLLVLLVKIIVHHQKLRVSGESRLQSVRKVVGTLVCAQSQVLKQGLLANLRLLKDTID